MKSATLPSFWKAYASLDEEIKHKAKKAFQLWARNPFHPSLRFKCINREENIWSVRITRGYRALGVFEGDTVTWLWFDKDKEAFTKQAIKLKLPSSSFYELQH